MRFSTTWVRGAIGVAAAFAFMAITAGVAQAAPQELKATAFNVNGVVNYKETDAGDWKPVKNGTQLGSGATIKTDPGATADLKVNNDKIRVQAGTTLKIDKLTSDIKGGDTITDTQLDLKAGNIIGKVDKKAGGSNYQVKTATGVAGIRGTTFSIFSNGMVLLADGGPVDVYVNGQLVGTLTEGKAFIPGPPPTIGDLPEGELRLIKQIVVTWEIVQIELRQAPDGTTQVLTGGVGGTGDGNDHPQKPAKK